MLSLARAFSFFACAGTAYSHLNDDLASATHPFNDECSAPALELLQLSMGRTKRATFSRPAKHNHQKNGLDPAVEATEVREWGASHVKGWGSNRWPDWPTAETLPAHVKMSDYSPPRPVRVLEWTNWRFYMENEPLESMGLTNCHIAAPKTPADDFIIRDIDYPIDEYDVIMFNFPALMMNYPENYVFPRRKLPGQLWIGLCGEPLRSLHNLDCRLVNDTQTMALMDGFASFSSESDVPAIQDPLLEETLRLPVPDFQSHGPELVSLCMADSVNPERNAWVESMMDALKERGQEVFSYGPWQHNAEEPICTEEEEAGAQKIGDGIRNWISRCAARPFKLVSEQVWEDGYVSEKVWDALGEGSIPIYWGTKDVERWVPPGSILHVSDFESVAALVDKIVNFSEEDFAAARAWKSKPTSEWGGWAEAWSLSHATLVPRICEKAARRFPSPRLHKYPLDAGIPSPAAHELPASLQLKTP